MGTAPAANALSTEVRSRIAALQHAQSRGLPLHRPGVLGTGEAVAGAGLSRRGRRLFWPQPGTARLSLAARAEEMGRPGRGAEECDQQLPTGEVAQRRLGHVAADARLYEDWRAVLGGRR